MENNFDGILDMYLFESTSLLTQLEELLIEAEKNGDFSENDINEIFRIMHTIKGSSAMMSFDVIMNVAHKMEDIFFFIRDTGISKINKELIPQLFNLMFFSSDFLTTEVNKLQNNQELTQSGDELYSIIDDFLQKLNNKPKEESTTLSQSVDTTNFPFGVNVSFEPGIGMEHIRGFMLLNALDSEGITYISNPDNLDQNPDTADIIAEDGLIIMLQNPEDAEAVINVLTDQPNIHSYELLDLSSAEVDDSAETDDTTNELIEDTDANIMKSPSEIKDNTPKAVSTSSKQSLISVNLAKLDALMAVVGEIVITESMVTSSSDLDGLELTNFNNSARQLRKLTDELQDIAMSLRMVSVSGVFNKMNRIVRDMNLKLDKNVELEIYGEETELDKSIIDSIGDPIMHIVRNSMDHGIEKDSKDRTLHKKSEKAKIRLSAKHAGSDVIIKIEDDGKGIDPEIILAKAKKNNLLTKPEAEYTKREILSLLMLPGFSTNENVTEFSGRGVGMDVVKKNIEDIGGSVSLSSELHKGTTTTLRIPLTLAIISGMKIKVGQEIYTIPIVDLKQSFNAAYSDIIHDIDNNEYIKRHGEILPIIRLHKLHNIEDGFSDIEKGILLWIESDELQYCLFVDDIIGEHQVVVKSLPVFLNNFNIKSSGISGCTILGDGSISVILDIVNLFELSKNI